MKEKIGRYKLLREIGKGGMAMVYKAMDNNTGRLVALKVLLPNMVDRSTVKRFDREAKALARLKHPNILTVYDYGMSEGDHYFAMEYLEGDTLKAIIKKKGSIPVNEALSIVLKVAEALSYAHEEGITHRDIKPGNIMVTTEGIVKVLDFGLVQIPGVTRITAEGSAIGTAEYMSPEQISDKAVDSRTDIYSLGVTMYEMLTGKCAFEGDTFQAVMMKHKYETPPPITQISAEIPKEVEEITSKSMSKVVSARYQKVSEMISDIRKFLGDQATIEEKVPQHEEKTKEPQVEKPEEVKAGVKEKKKIGIKPIIISLIIIAAIGYFYSSNKGLVPSPSSLFTKTKSVVSRSDNLKGEAENIYKNLQTAEGHYDTAKRFYRMGMVNEAIKEYEIAISYRPEYMLYYEDLAIAYEAKGDYYNARKTWKELLGIERRGPLAETAREHLEMLKNK